MPVTECQSPVAVMSSTVPVEEEEEAADLSVLNDTIEGGRLWLSQGASLKPDESEGCEGHDDRDRDSETLFRV